MRCQTDVRVNQREDRPETVLTDKRVRFFDYVEVQRINAIRYQDDHVEQSHVLKNQIRWRAKVFPLEDSDGDNTHQNTEDRHWENDFTVYL